MMLILSEYQPLFMEYASEHDPESYIKGMEKAIEQKEKKRG
jgi:hypothetical protein